MTSYNGTRGTSMRLELDKESRILGTKRISAKGQISGLTKYAGRDVLIILVGEGAKAVSAGPEEIVSELQRSLNDHMGLLFKQYERLRDTFNTPTEATKQFLRVVKPRFAGNLFEQMEHWTKRISKSGIGQLSERSDDDVFTPDEEDEAETDAEAEAEPGNDDEELE